MDISIRHSRVGGAVRCNVEELACRRNGIVPSEIEVLACDARQGFIRLMLNRLLRSDRIGADQLLGPRLVLQVLLLQTEGAFGGRDDAARVRDAEINVRTGGSTPDLCCWMVCFSSSAFSLDVNIPRRIR